METQSLWLKDMEQTTRNAAKIQRDMLQQILERNVTTEYLQRCGVQNHTNLCDEFKKLPLVEYDDIENEINRIADGDSSPILCSDPICYFFISSGTTNGKSKLIPMTETTLAETHEQVFKINMNEVYLAFWFASKQFYTRSGIKAATVTTSGLRSDTFKHKASAFVTPVKVYLATNIYQCMYCHLLCGLIRSKDVTVITSAFAFTIAEALRMLEEVWQELVNDIMTGTLSSRITDSTLRYAVSSLLQPNPELASHICRACENCSSSTWDGIVERLWPNAKYILAVTTGAMAPYVPILRGYAGKTPIVSGNYFSSESLIGINLNPKSTPETVEFTVNPKFAYFEFLEDGTDDADETVALTDVKIGRKYEIIVTTHAGLYRYRLGDVVKVTGFYNASPTISFLFRNKVILSVATDKTDESELQRAVQKASMLLRNDAQLREFTSHADYSSRPGHYVIFWELKSGNSIDPGNLQECCDMLDVSFSNPYMRGRSSHAIGPLELCIVKGGTFRSIMAHQVERGASASQYKASRCISNTEVLKILQENTIQQALSAQFPDSVLESWSPYT